MSLPIVIAGPTAVGKTKLALEIAARKPTAIITIDSRHIYKGLSILSGWDLPKTESHDLTFHGFGLIEPHVTFSAHDYANFVRQTIAAQKDKQVILVGGSGFYLHYLIHEHEMTARSPDNALRQSLSLKTKKELQSLLQSKAPGVLESLNQSDQNNPRRLIRRLEIAFADNKVERPSKLDIGPMYAIRPPGTDLYRSQIRDRINTRLAQGAIQQVRDLLSTYPHLLEAPIATTTGFMPIVNYLNGQIEKDKLVEDWLTSEYQYAKRQLTWFRKMTDLIWYDQGIKEADLKK